MVFISWLRAWLHERDWLSLLTWLSLNMLRLRKSASQKSVSDHSKTNTFELTTDDCRKTEKKHAYQAQIYSKTASKSLNKFSAIWKMLTIVNNHI